MHLEYIPNFIIQSGVVITRFNTFRFHIRYWYHINETSNSQKTSIPRFTGEQWVTIVRIREKIDHDIHYNDVIMSAMASQIISLTIIYSTVYSGADKRKHQNSASLSFVRWNHRRPVNSTHKGPVTRQMFPFDDAIMNDAKFYLPWHICVHGSLWYDYI